MTPAVRLPFDPLRTDRLILRHAQEADFEAHAAFSAGPRSRWIGGPHSRAVAWRGFLAGIGHWALRGHGFWTVEVAATGAVAGRVGVIFNDGWPAPELGWHLFEGFEGQGIAAEAARAAKADYHARISTDPLISLIDPANVRSRTLAERLGARRDGEVELFDTMVELWRHPGQEDRP